MTNKTYNVLILCTGNSARSVMAEGLFNVMGKGRFKAYSAGSQPTGMVNPFAVEKLQALGYDTTNVRSKSWDEFAAPDAPQMDMVITVCDNAAGEVCPFWPGQPMTAHWGFYDPAGVQGSNEDKRRAFQDVFTQIQKRVQLFMDLPLEKMERLAIQSEMKAIGQKAP